MNIGVQNQNQLETMRKNLKALREAKLWSICELSEISGINEKILTGIENGKDFEVQYLFDLCRIYNIQPHKIFLKL